MTALIPECSGCWMEKSSGAERMAPQTSHAPIAIRLRVCVGSLLATLRSKSNQSARLIFRSASTSAARGIRMQLRLDTKAESCWPYPPLSPTNHVEFLFKLRSTNASIPFLTQVACFLKLAKDNSIFLARSVTMITGGSAWLETLFRKRSRPDTRCIGWSGRSLGPCNGASVIA